VSPGQPSLISDDADVVALIGTSKDLAKQINQKELHWGVCMFSIKLAVSFFFCEQTCCFLL
jgi:transcription initiation factor TFIID subunit 5